MLSAREWLNGWLNNSLTQAVRRIVGRKRTAIAGEHYPMKRELGTPLAGNSSSATLRGVPHRSLFPHALKRATKTGWLGQPSEQIAAIPSGTAVGRARAAVWSNFREGGAHCPLNGAAEYYPQDPHQQPHSLLDELWYSGYWKLEAVGCLDCQEENQPWCRELGHQVIYRHVRTAVQ